MHYKDAILDHLADRTNVAQFVSFAPDLSQRYARLFDHEPNYCFDSLEQAVEALLTESVERSVNVRSYDPASPKKRPFFYGITDVKEATDHVRKLAGEGLHTIINETIDIHDGGVSGVALGNLIEFAPDDTPRAVEQSGTAALPRQLGLKLLSTVYGFTPELDYDLTTRVEFSIHPLRRGVHRSHTIIWELEDDQHTPTEPEIQWPNRFSQFLGDKVYGLLVAHLIEMPVPEITCISRRIAPFRFGYPTETGETWIRTAPTVQMPGKFTTLRGWTDPFRLMSEEDPTGEYIGSILAQSGVNAVYSGALVSTENHELTIEGTQGYGDEFMTGKKLRTSIPNTVSEAVKSLYIKAAEKLGPVRLEWVYDGRQVWVVQLHKGASTSSGRTIFPGEVQVYRRFNVEEGLEPLRELLNEIKATGEGVMLVGDVGITSHLGDILRKAQIPSFIEAE
jgi:hypothetical protein